MASLNGENPTAATRKRWLRTAAISIAVVVGFAAGWQSHLGRATYDRFHTREERFCAEYVLQGFASERVRAHREAAFLARLQEHGAAVFDAIADGLTHRETFRPEPLTETDIQLAVAELQKRGWSDQMRAALADPNQMRALPHELVCRVQREWLAAVASLSEPTRTRFYREMLGPMLRS